MKYYVNIFRAREKKSEKSPDYTLILKPVDSTEDKETHLYGGLWVKESQKGTKYFSGQIELPDVSPAAEAPPPDFDDDIPF